jgi:hypothetical protein
MEVHAERLPPGAAETLGRTWRMRALVWISIVCLSMMAKTALAASYQQQNGTVIDPILDIFTNVHPYAGANLAPSATLSGAALALADLDSADLASASLAGANLSSADLDHADLSLADLSGAQLVDTNLRFAVFNGAQLNGADLSGAQLANAIGLGLSSGSALYSAQTDFTGTSFDPVAAGWSLVPEPNTALHLGLGLAGLGRSQGLRVRG